jgi:hypothetical protein
MTNHKLLSTALSYPATLFEPSRTQRHFSALAVVAKDVGDQNVDNSPLAQGAVDEFVCLLWGTLDRKLRHRLRAVYHVHWEMRGIFWNKLRFSRWRSQCRVRDDLDKVVGRERSWSSRIPGLLVSTSHGAENNGGQVRSSSDVDAR